MSVSTLAPRPPSRPRLALVLSSGGVRSVAGIGAADVLAQAGLAPDLIVGCSSGALCGAALAMGLSAELSMLAMRAYWEPRLTQQRRWRAYLQMAAPRLAGFGEDFALRDSRLIARALDHGFGDRLLEALPIPLRITATDAATGGAVVLRRGRVADAVRASMAVPLIFPSVPFDGRRLVDGVVSDPLPIGAADDAALVVAMGFRGQMPRRVDRLSRLAAQASTTLINNLMDARVQAARAAGRRLVCLDLDLERPVGLWDTAAMPELYEAGRRAARARLPQIRALLEAAEPRAAA